MVHDAIAYAPYVSFRFLNLMAVRLKPLLQKHRLKPLLQKYRLKPLLHEGLAQASTLAWLKKLEY